MSLACEVTPTVLQGSQVALFICGIEVPIEKVEVNAVQRAYFDSAGRVDLGNLTRAKKWIAFRALTDVGRFGGGWQYFWNRDFHDGHSCRAVFFYARLV